MTNLVAYSTASAPPGIYEQANIWFDISQSVTSGSYGLTWGQDVCNSNSYTITNLTASNISASGTSSFGYVGIGATSFVYGAANRGLLEIYGSSDALIALRNATANFYIHKLGNNFAMVNGGAGYMTFNTNGSDRLFIDSNGYIGIGTTSFVYGAANRGLLEVYGSTDALISLRNATTNSYIQKSGNDFYINNGGAGVISIATNSSERMRIASDGNVGIGTTVTAARLHVNSTTPGDTLFRTDGTNGTLFSVVDDLSDSLMSVNNSAGLPVFEVFADDRIVAGQYGQNDFVVRNNKVGIGTNNPSKLLHVAGDMVVATTSKSGTIFFGTDGGTETYIRRDNNYDLIVAQNDASGNGLYLAGAGSVYVSIDSNNNGTTDAFIVQNNSIKHLLQFYFQPKNL